MRHGVGGQEEEEGGDTVKASRVQQAQIKAEGGGAGAHGTRQHAMRRATSETIQPCQRPSDEPMREPLSNCEEAA